MVIYILHLNCQCILILKYHKKNGETQLTLSISFQSYAPVCTLLAVVGRRATILFWQNFLSSSVLMFHLLFEVACSLIGSFSWTSLLVIMTNERMEVEDLHGCYFLCSYRRTLVGGTREMPKIM